MERQCCRLPGSKHCLDECKTTRQVLPAAHWDNLRHGAAGFLCQNTIWAGGRALTWVYFHLCFAWEPLHGTVLAVWLNGPGFSQAIWHSPWNGLWSRAHATCSIYLMQKAHYKVCHCYEAFPPKNELIQFLWAAFKNEIGGASATGKAEEAIYHLCRVLVTFSLTPLQ